MGPDEILKYAADNCPYKKFKWHTEDMCKNCREVAEEIRAIAKKEADDARKKEKEDMALAVLNIIKIERQTIMTMQSGFFSKLFGVRGAALTSVEMIERAIKKLRDE